MTLTGHGNGPIAAFCEAINQLGVDVRVLDYAEHAMSSGGDAPAAAHVQGAAGPRVPRGVRRHPPIVRPPPHATVGSPAGLVRPPQESPAHPLHPESPTKQRRDEAATPPRDPRPVRGGLLCAPGRRGPGAPGEWVEGQGVERGGGP